MSKQSKDAALAAFRQVYESVHGTQPVIEEFKGGWYTVNGSEKIRLKRIKEMTNDMENTVTQEATTATEAQAETKEVSIGVRDLAVMYAAVNAGAKAGVYAPADFVTIGLAMQNVKGFLEAYNAQNASSEDQSEATDEAGE